ncbi:MAG: YceH family protein [Actinomycetota bacterium]|nr:YceH family protein [Actinomycetota bacterium]
MQLSPVQVRILGCLLEKERTTPDNYPLTMNALLSACNQTTNRYPVVTFNQGTVELAIENLKAENLLRIDYSRSNRADKYRHVLDQALGLDEAEAALLAVLMLRGPQTAAELRARSERLHEFVDQGEVDAVLARLAHRPEPLVVRLGAAPGQKESRWAHLLSGDVPVDATAPATQESARSGRIDRLQVLEDAVAVLRAELDALRAEHDALEARFHELTG